MRVLCLKYGRSLDDAGTDRLPWMDLAAMITAADPGDPIFDAEVPGSAGWTKTNMLLADIADALHVLMWQGGRRRRADFPRPIPRPGFEEKNVKTFGDTMEFDDAVEFLDRKRAGRPAA